MPQPTLSILVATLATRTRHLEKLKDCLRPQLEDLDGVVEVLIESDNGIISTGEKRNRLLERARGKWLVFLDDDDLVADDYVPSVLKALEADPDCVGYWAQYYEDGCPAGKLFYTIRNNGYNEITQDGQILRQRTPNHICPIRSTFAKRVAFKEITTGEDNDYAQRVYPSLVSEVFIDRVMYHYYWRSNKYDGYQIGVSYRSDDTEAIKSRIQQWLAAAKYPERIAFKVQVADDMNTPAFKEWCRDFGVGESPAPSQVIIYCRDEYEAAKDWDVAIDNLLPSTSHALWLYDGRQKHTATIAVIGVDALPVPSPSHTDTYQDNRLTDDLQRDGLLKFVSAPAIIARTKSWKKTASDRAAYLADGGKFVPLVGQVN